MWQSLNGLSRGLFTEKVSFSTVLQKDNWVQVPRLVRGRFKMDSTQALKVSVTVVGIWGGWYTFYARMGRDGRITVPKLMRKMLQGEQQKLEGCVLNVMLEPA